MFAFAFMLTLRSFLKSDQYISMGTFITFVEGQKWSLLASKEEKKRRSEQGHTNTLVIG
jgi:hypothetical protein